MSKIVKLLVWCQMRQIDTVVTNCRFLVSHWAWKTLYLNHLLNIIVSCYLSPFIQAQTISLKLNECMMDLLTNRLTDKMTKRLTDGQTRTPSYGYAKMKQSTSHLLTHFDYSGSRMMNRFLLMCYSWRRKGLGKTVIRKKVIINEAHNSFRRKKSSFLYTYFLRIRRLCCR